ncbi:tetratricopeptide repeat protein 16 isoform 2-T2 [Ciconia maguari]
MQGIHDPSPSLSPSPALGGSWPCQRSRAFFQDCVTVPPASSMSLGFAHGSFCLHSGWTSPPVASGRKPSPAIWKPSTWIRRGIVCLMALSEFLECLWMLNRDLEEDAKNPDLYVLRASFYERFGQDIRRALELQPQHGAAQALRRRRAETRPGGQG